MTSVGAELLAVVERSPQATAAHDRPSWVGLFTPDGRVEDPYGSRPHVGYDRIGRFYDTFIAPRRVVFRRDVDVVAGNAVVRDLTLEIVMDAAVTLDVPMHLRYDLRECNGDWAIQRLRAHWELPLMVVTMLRQGARSLPVSARLAAELLRNQGLSGTAGFVSGFVRPGRRQRRRVAALLDAAVAGDHVGVRRALSHGASVTHGEDVPLAAGDLVDRLRGGHWTKPIAAGDTVSASVHTPSGRGVVFCEIPSIATGVTRIQYFGPQ